MSHSLHAGASRRLPLSLLTLALPWLLAACASPAAGPQATGSHTGEPLRVENAWVRPVEVGATTAGYFTLVNETLDSLVLVGVDVPAAAASMMHETVKDSAGMMAMQHVERFAVAPRGRLEFGPGGNHVMAMQAYVALAEGDTTGLVLRFADGRTLRVTAQVKTSAE